MTTKASNAPRHSIFCTPDKNVEKININLNCELK